MKIDRINFLFYFKIYLTLLTIFAVFHLYFKHTGGTDSTISEWKKYYLVFIFVFFCFGWNTKTLYKEDIGSFPEYRVPYLFFKTLINNIN